MNTAQKLVLAAEKIGYVRGALVAATNEATRTCYRQELWEAAELLVELLEDQPQ